MTLVTLITVGAACSSPSSTQGQIPSQVSGTVPKSAAHKEDQILKIGVLLPRSGPGSNIGVSISRAVLTAQRLINDDGGVLDNPITILQRNEGSDASTVLASARELIDLGVDVIVGPASSNSALAVLPTIIGADVAVCSPAATAIALDSFPDEGLLVRTIASDTLQAEAMATQLEDTGLADVSVAYVDDSYGRGFFSALEQALVRHDLNLKATVAYSTIDDDFGTEAAALLVSGNGSIALIGDADAGPRLLSAVVRQQTATGPRGIFLNDTFRQPLALDILRTLPPEARSVIHGVAPTVVSINEPFLAELNVGKSPVASTVFASQAFDCVNLAALAAIKMESTNGRTLLSQAESSTNGGSRCASFVECRPLVGANFDYNGPDGTLDIGRTGDRTRGLFEAFSFDADGRDIADGAPFAVSIPT